jgi:tight adherence protein C
MLDYLGLNPQTLIVYISAIAAALSFAAFIYPFLKRNERRQRYKRLIEKRSKSLYEQSREEVNNRRQGQQASTRDTLAGAFKVQQMFGDLGEKIRDQMLQAGVRSPNAPIYYIIGRIVLPVILAGLTLLIMTQGEKQYSGSTVLIMVLVLALIGFFLPRILIKNYVQKRQQEINQTFPDALDMMLICVQGGIGLEQTIGKIADEISGHSATLAEELGILAAEMGMLNDRKAALQDFARRVGSGSAKSFATAMIQAEQYGTSISSAMRVIADELRDERMAEAERKAAALPPKLTVPMILFFLPALFVVILGPVGIKMSMSGS